jgi:hypothetical protein
MRNGSTQPSGKLDKAGVKTLWFVFGLGFGLSLLDRLRPKLGFGLMP